MGAQRGEEANVTRIEKQFAASIGLLWLSWLAQHGSPEEQEEAHTLSKALFESFGLQVQYRASFASLAMVMLREWSDEAKK